MNRSANEGPLLKLSLPHGWWRKENGSHTFNCSCPGEVWPLLPLFISRHRSSHFPFPLCPLGRGSEHATKRVPRIKRERPSLRWNQRRFIEQIGSSPSVVGGEPSPCSAPMLAANADREQWFSTLLFESGWLDALRLWLRTWVVSVHTMQFRVHLRGVDRGKGVEILPFVVKEFDVFTQISLSLLRLKLVGFKAALFCSKVKRFLFFSKFLWESFKNKIKDQVLDLSQ